VRVFYELGVLDIICDLDDNILSARKKDYSKLKTTNNFNDILSDKNIKGVVISSPASTHYKLAKQSFLALKKFFCRKTFIS